MRYGRMVCGAGLLALLTVAGVVSPARAQPARDSGTPAPSGLPRDGVITPPPIVDPGLRKTPPAAGTAGTVIAPPGTAGNQPDVVPK